MLLCYTHCKEQTITNGLQAVPDADHGLMPDLHLVKDIMKIIYLRFVEKITLSSSEACYTQNRPIRPQAKLNVCLRHCILTLGLYYLPKLPFALQVLSGSCTCKIKYNMERSGMFLKEVKTYHQNNKTKLEFFNNEFPRFREHHMLQKHIMK